VINQDLVSKPTLRRLIPAALAQASRPSQKRMKSTPPPQALLHARLPCGTNLMVGTILRSLQQLSHAFVNKLFPPLTN
jgi:hypothetical protein